MLYEEGLVVKTSIDTNLQKILDQVLIDSLINQDKKYGWRGSIVKNNETDTFDSFAKNVKSPFPKKWLKYKVIDVDKNILTVISEDSKKYKIYLNQEENKWLLDEKFLYGDIFFAEFVNSSLIIRQIPEVNGAIVAIDPHTGKVLALSGGFSFELSEFNRATQAYRQPGSAFKPFVYISALKEGYSPSTLVLDAPYVVDQGPGLPKWKPLTILINFMD